jgi:bifunctional ADP-heptose synthase (sugar kinase/adenylyltransferase)/phosphoglycolate phosphatase-like HAD superfamily hydrolase
MHLPESDIRHMLEDIEKRRFGIIGDFCLDVYLVVDSSASEVSVETGLATQPISEQRYSLGGAGNVAANLRALGAGAVRAFGVTGSDPHGAEMRRIMERSGILTESLQVQRRSWDTHAYTKLIVGDREQPRLDYGNFNALAADTARALLEELERHLPGLDVLIINQQVLRGIHTPEFRRELRTLLEGRPETLALVDSRSCADEFGTACHKLNAREGAALCGRCYGPEDRVPVEELRQIGRSLFERWGKPVFLTRGSYGCLVQDQEGSHEIPGLLLTGRVDPVGAGDSMLAGIAAGLAAGRSPTEAAALGNLVAGVTVQKLFVTGTASPAEVLALAAEANYRHHPELAALPQRARFHRDTEIELVNALPPLRLRLRHAIFDNDGTVSTLRQGWEEVMEPVMVRAILGDRLGDIGESVYTRVQQRVREYIDRTTGVQTLVQMVGLTEMVREFGLVPESRILDEHGYKAIFNEQLMCRVEARLAKLRGGELALSDLTLKNAVPFLEALRARDVRLYLASGTDQADVEREAEALGYAGLFESRIYGAVGDIRHEPKRVVLESILARIDEEGGTRAGRGVQGRAAAAAREGATLVTFGDGPVEIQQTLGRGGLTVGVASDEVRRYGLNPVKRRRLIQAGADLIIPDFSQMEPLLSLLFPD